MLHDIFIQIMFLRGLYGVEIFMIELKEDKLPSKVLGRGSAPQTLPCPRHFCPLSPDMFSPFHPHLTAYFPGMWVSGSTIREHPFPPLTSAALLRLSGTTLGLF